MDQCVSILGESRMIWVIYHTGICFLRWFCIDYVLLGKLYVSIYHTICASIRKHDLDDLGRPDLSDVWRVPTDEEQR